MEASGPEQRPETFLLEMPVIGEHVGQSFPAHGLHADAICQAVALIRAGLIKIACSKARPAVSFKAGLIFGAAGESFRWNLAHSVEHDIGHGLQGTRIGGIQIAFRLLLGHFFFDPGLKCKAVPGCFGLQHSRIIVG